MIILNKNASSLGKEQNSFLRYSRTPRSPLQACRLTGHLNSALLLGWHHRTMLKQNKLIFQRHVVHSVQMLKIINRNRTEAKIPSPILMILNCCCNSQIQVGTRDICALRSTQEPSGSFNTWFEGQNILQQWRDAWYKDNNWKLKTPLS